jgi:glycogen debranching enzyme
MFDVHLLPGESWSTCVDVEVKVGDDVRSPLVRCGQFGKPLHDMPMGFDEWMTQAPQIDTDSQVIRRAVEQGLADLASLRLRPNAQLPWSVPAGGMPWFMALFGRDTIWAAFQALPFHSELAQTTLVSLASYQAESDDPYRDAEPGKILHEMRCGPLADSGALPHRPYYGTHDATSLFVMLLNEYHLWTADDDLVRTLEPNLRAALTWIERHGDLDGDGFLEYRTRSSKGLRNHCWKDSDDSIRFADGALASGPIATCELQAYAYRARLDAVRLMREVLDDATTARRLERDADELKARFDEAFWSDARRQYVLALDGEKRQVDSMTSNVGHLLFCGIVPDARAESACARLMASDMFSGWGLRTMSALDGGYNPFGYHIGSVWPFDTAIAAEGLRRYGREDEAAKLAFALFDAADRFDHRLPEVFAGLARDRADVPTAYPGANSPQAFSAGAPLLLVRTLLGLEIEDGALVSRPIHSTRVGHLHLLGIRAAGRHRNVPEHLNPEHVR